MKYAEQYRDTCHSEYDDDSCDRTFDIRLLEGIDYTRLCTYERTYIRQISDSYFQSKENWTHSNDFQREVNYFVMGRRDEERDE